MLRHPHRLGPFTNIHFSKLCLSPSLQIIQPNCPACHDKTQIPSQESSGKLLQEHNHSQTLLSLENVHTCVCLPVRLPAYLPQRRRKSKI